MISARNTHKAEEETRRGKQRRKPGEKPGEVDFRGEGSLWEGSSREELNEERSCGILGGKYLGICIPGKRKAGTKVPRQSLACVRNRKEASLMGTW